MVNINTDRGKYRLRWSYRGKRYTLSIGNISKDSLKAAQAKAALIESDILFERFDVTLSKYSIRRGDLLLEQTSILTAWEQYKKTNSNRIALTSQQNGWKNVDRCLAKAPSRLLALDKADELVNELLNHYSGGTLKRVLIDLNAASNNYYSIKKLPRVGTHSSIKCFSDCEVKSIIDSFQTNRFNPHCSAYCQSYYTNYVRFLAYTGCRPEEAIALTWNDIDNSSLRFDKAYSKGILKDTKNHKIRDFPINNQLRKLLSGVSRNSELVFPSVTDGYICQQTWHQRNWRPIINNLVELKLVKEYLRSYCLRHSFITRCIRAGMDVASVAEITGNTTETIYRYYLSARSIDELEPPEI